MTASYKVVIKKSAEKELHAIPSMDLERIAAKLKTLALTPRPHGCEKMAGDNRYRMRQGDWRVVYSIDDPQKTVVVYKIGHRGEIYR